MPTDKLDNAIIKIVSNHTREYNELSQKYTKLLSDLINYKLIIRDQKERIKQMEKDIVEDLYFMKDYPENDIKELISKWEALQQWSPNCSI